MKKKLLFIFITAAFIINMSIKAIFFNKLYLRGISLYCYKYKEYEYKIQCVSLQKNFVSLLKKLEDRIEESRRHIFFITLSLIRKGKNDNEISTLKGYSDRYFNKALTLIKNLKLNGLNVVYGENFNEYFNKDFEAYYKEQDELDVLLQKPSYRNLANYGNKLVPIIEKFTKDAKCMAKNICEFL